LREIHGCASIGGVIEHITPQLRTLIEAAVAEGVGMDDIEHELIEPANLHREDHDAVWLYALGLREHPQRREIPIIAG
jgi:hypothetical protein